MRILKNNGQAPISSFKTLLAVLIGALTIGTIGSISILSEKVPDKYLTSFGTLIAISAILIVIIVSRKRDFEAI